MSSKDTIRRGKPRKLPATRAALASVFALSIAVFPALAAAQYPGQVSQAGKDDKAPTLRAVGVLEWTGDVAHPKFSRLVPVTVYDGNELQDASIYLARPQPLALQSEVEYQLLSDGKVTGLFDIQSAGRLQGCWVGLGKWKALPAPKLVAQAPARIDEDDDANRGPVLHRKAHAGDSSGGSGGGSGSSGPGGSSGSAGSGSPDPDRPTLHRSSSGDSSGTQTGDSSASNAPAADPDRPTLHRSPSSDSSADSSSGTSSSAAGRSTAKTSAGKDTVSVESLPEVTDPNRPRLVRGKPADSGPAVAPTLVGLPEEMEQAVAVSDPRNRPEHLWTYSWADPETETGMKADLESIARDALGLGSPAPAPAVSQDKPSIKTASTLATPSKAAKTSSGSRSNSSPPASTAQPAPLLDEQFRVYELAYGGGATMVFSARADAVKTGGSGKPNAGGAVGSAPAHRFVTIVAQPDLYGKVVVLLKNVTDSAHLDVTPRMRLIDAVDALADNRGDLLFELRGSTQRQFALYRVLRGQITQIFLGSGGALGAATAR